MLVIKNIKRSYMDFKRIQDLFNIINKRMYKLKLHTNPTIVNDNIIFNDGSDGKTFRSAIDNIIPLSVDDPRRKEKNRDYLESKRPTHKQYSGFFNIIQDTLDELDLEAEIELTIKKKQIINLRNGKTKFHFPLQKSYPIERN